MYIVVGLGNPGQRYAGTRHNIGFDTIDYFAAKHGINVNKLKQRALQGEGRIAGQRVILAKPQTYMNLSGEAVRALLEYYKLDSQNIIVIYDDIDLPVGALRIRHKGSAGTHNGMRSILYHLASEQFPRMRIGVGKSDIIPLKDYVMTRYQKDEVPLMEDAVKRCALAIETTISDNLDKAMNLYNG